MVRLVKSALKGLLTDRELSLVQSSFDIVGDIAIMKLPEAVLPKRYEIGEALLKRLTQVRTVLRQVSGYAGEYRTRELEVLAGENEFETMYREHGCIFRVDLRSTYFSPRLAYERYRIANLVKGQEVVVNLFGGVGTFSIIIAKEQPACTGYSIDLNPSAHALAIENILRNKLAHRVVALQGNAREIVGEYLSGRAHRVLMPLPERSKEFLETAVAALKLGGGIIHYYSFVRADRNENPIALTEEELKRTLTVPYEILVARVVTEVAPRMSEVVIDVRVLRPN